MPNSNSNKQQAPASPAAPDMRERLRDDILACRLQPGERLKFDALRSRYSASVGTLREVLSQLVSEGLVHAEANRGFAVAPVSVADLLDIVELRVDLECKALIAAIEHGNDEWEAEILAAFHLMHKAEREAKDPAGDHGLWAQRHKRFHEALVAACPSPWLLRFRQILFDQARRYRALSMKHSSSPGRMQQHRQLMDAVVGRDAKAACALAEAHIRDTARNVLAGLPGYTGLPRSRPAKPHARSG